MPAITLYILASPQTQEGMARFVNGFETARDLKRRGADVRIVFDGAGTQWIPEISRPESKFYPLFQELQENIEGVCAFCSAAFGAREAAEQARIPLLEGPTGHVDLATRLMKGEPILPF